MSSDLVTHGSTEQKRSKLLAFLKFKLLTLLPIKLDIQINSTQNNYIFCLSSSYKHKPEIYRQIASSLGFGIITCKPSLFKKEQIKPTNINKISFWSDVQILPRLIIINNNLSGRYSVYQHGKLAYDQQALSGPSSLEWMNTKAYIYYVWSEHDKTQIKRYRPNLSTFVIETPIEKKREVMPGTGFATRGPEYMSNDLLYFQEKCSKHIRINLHFHPSYFFLKKYFFVLSCTMKGYKVTICKKNTISENTVTLSESINSIISISSSDNDKSSP